LAAWRDAAQPSLQLMGVFLLSDAAALEHVAEQLAACCDALLSVAGAVLLKPS